MLINECGTSPTQIITAAGISHPLLCAMRLHVANETEIDMLCPAGDSIWKDHECKCLEYEDPSQRKCLKHDIRLNITQPLSQRNERETLEALRGIILSLRSGYASGIEEDEVMLNFSSLRENPLLLAALRVRLWEKYILRSALDEIEARLSTGSLDKNLYQVIFSQGFV